MSTVQERRARARIKTLIYGVISVALYAGAFTFADVITPFFAKGGIHCLLPVATVFVFSYFHSNFAGNLWTALGIEASSKVDRPAVSVRQRTDKRPRAVFQA